MYSNYQSFNNSMNSPMMSSSSMMPREYSMSSSSMGQDSRLIGGGFLGPFVLGGITGGLLAPAFYPRPYYNNYYPRPYPYYGPYYR